MGLFSFLGKPELPRQSRFDGFLYPDDPGELRAITETATQDGAREGRAIVVPHSDLDIVGPVAAAGFSRLLRAERVVVIGPSHKIPFAGLAVPNADGWTTPLGTMRIDTAAYEAVEPHGLVRVMDPAFEPEPAVEVQLPWVQTIQPKCRVVPFLCGDANAVAVADLLDDLLDDDTVLVVACEFSWDRSEREVVRLDEATLEAVEAGDLDGFDRGHVTAGTPLGALMLLAERHGWAVERLIHRTSRDLGASDDRVAGYAASLFGESMTIIPESASRYPERIVCLVEEPTEILYALGEEDRIVGISAYTVRPPEAKETKPVVSAFIGGSVKKITALKPDLVIGFSDIQADLARDLIAAGLDVLVFNQRSIAEILDVVLAIGRLVGAQERARDLVAGYREGLRAARERTAQQARHPRVYFEEWGDPICVGIRWVSELIELAGGEDVFAERSRSGPMATQRAAQHAEVIERAPEAIIASWCGEPVDRDAIRRREGYAEIPAVANDEIHEIDSSLILQPGPAALTDGLAALESIIRPLAE